MLQSGLERVRADRRDYSLLHTFGAVGFEGLPADFSVYSGQVIPNQSAPDTRFNPALPPLPFGCTGETGAFESGIQDGKLYDPKDLYDNTPPGGQGGRDIRAMLTVLKNRGPREGNGGAFGPKRRAYFNCYGAGAVDDFDAARIGIWITQNEKRGVYIGSWFYPEFVEPVEGSGGGVAHVGPDGITPIPSFNTRQASLHCYLATGWKTINGKIYLECLTWQGMGVGFKGVIYFSREMYNALMAQPYTGAFTITKLGANSPIPVGFQAIIDQLVYFLRSLLNISPYKPAPEPPQPPAPQPPMPPKPESPAEKLAEAAKAVLGKDVSPKDLAPDEFGCAESVSNIIHSIWPDFPGEVLSTADLYRILSKSSRFQLVQDPVRGCVVVSPRTPTVAGHTGIYTEADTIASNDSRNGLFQENYTRQSWRSYFIKGKGLKGYLFKPV